MVTTVLGRPQANESFVAFMQGLSSDPMDLLKAASLSPGQDFLKCLKLEKISEK